MQWGNMVTCASITLLPQNRNINYPTKLIVIYSNICCAVDWSGVISPKALWQKKLYFGSNFRPCCSADGSLRERFEVMMVLLCGWSLVMSHRLEMHARPIQDSCSWFLSALRGQAARHRCVWVLLASLLDPPEQRSRKRLCVEPACFTRQLQEQDSTQIS